MAESVLAFLAAGALALAAAGLLAHRLRLPPALGYLAVGVALVPVLRRLDVPGAPVADAAEVAVLALLFFIGLELDLKRLLETLRGTAFITGLDILLPGLAGAAVGRLLGWSVAEALVLGMCLSVSSTLFGERLSASRGFGAAPRRRVLGVLLGEDVAVAALFAFLVILGGEQASGAELWTGPVLAVGKLLVLLLVVAAAAIYIVPRFLDYVAATHVHELLVLSAVFIVVAFGYLGFWAGSAELGALVAGVACAEAGSRFVVRNGLLSLRDVAMAVFFLASGLAADPAAIAGHWGASLALAAVFIIAKVFVHVPAALASGFSLREALHVGLGLGAIGEFSLILASAAVAQGVAHPDLQTTVVGALLFALVATPLLLRGVPSIVRALGRLPAPLRRPLRTVLGLARRTVSKTDRQQEEILRARMRERVRVLVANLVLLGLLVAAAAYLAPRSEDWGGLERPYILPVVVLGLAIALATPFLWKAYRSYRDIVRILLRVGEAAEGQARLRHRLVDAWVAFTALLLVAPLTFFVPGTLPVLAGAFFLAISIALVAWRQLNIMQRTLQGSVARVLGEETDTGDLLDRILEKYPWGVRFAAVPVPPGSPVAGQTLERARITQLTGAAVAVLQRRHREIVNPEKDQLLLVGDTLVLMGEPHQIARAEALIVAHGEALRLTAQSRVARVVEVNIASGSALVGQTLGQADLKERAGTLVIGVRPDGSDHPLPFRADLTLLPGDQVLLLGTPLQIERARIVCEGGPPGASDAERLAGSQDRAVGWGENA